MDESALEIPKDILNIITNQPNVIFEQIHRERPALKPAPVSSSEQAPSIILDLKVLPRDSEMLQQILRTAVQANNFGVVAYKDEDAAMKSSLQRLLGREANRLFFERVTGMADISALARTLEVKGGDSTEQFYAVMNEKRSLVSDDIRRMKKLVFELKPELLRHIGNILPILQRIAIAPDDLRQAYLKELGLRQDAASGVTLVTTRFLENLIQIAERASQFAKAA
jgi:hypothetical protein